MDTNHCEPITRFLTAIPSRRDLLRGLATAGIGSGIARLQLTAVGKRKRKRKHKNQDKKSKPNAFGCLDVGDACTSAAPCCSGLCEGKKGKRKCVGHSAGICGADSDLCTAGAARYCHPTKPFCVCSLTTGNAAFCADFTVGMGREVPCRVCHTDTDCQAEFGPGAACLVLGGICTEVCPTTGGTACAPPCA
jgi:hypothetical protein